MKYIAAIILFFIVNNVCINSQSYIFSYSPNKEILNIGLHFYSDSTYMMMFDCRYPKTDYITISPISMGLVFEYDNNFILIDTLSRAEIKLKRSIENNNDLIIEKGFAWMRGEKFLLVEENIEKSSALEDYIPNKYEILSKENEIKTANPSNNDLLSGWYLFNNDFKIRICDDFTYLIFRYDFEFSKGYWSRESNILWLFDTTICSKYKMYINNDKSLTSLFIPGDFLMRNFKFQE